MLVYVWLWILHSLCQIFQNVYFKALNSARNRRFYRTNDIFPSMADNVFQFWIRIYEKTCKVRPGQRFLIGQPVTVSDLKDELQSPLAGLEYKFIAKLNIIERLQLVWMKMKNTAVLLANTVEKG